MPIKQNAVLYLRTTGDRYTPEEISQLLALKVFAEAQGWTLTGAAVEQRASHRLWDEIREDFENGKIHAVLMWDEEFRSPGVWEDDLPVL